MKRLLFFLQSSSTAHNINLGVSSNFSSQFLLEIIDEYEEKKNDVSIRVYVDSREKIIQKLNAGIINLAILDGDIGVEDNSAEPFFEDEIFIISSKNSSINDKDVLEAEDLKNKKFVLGDLDAYSKKILLNYLREKSIPIDLKFICQNKDMVLNIVKNTDALSIGASSSFNDHDLVKHRLSDISIKRTYYLVYHNDAFLKKNLKNFVNFVKNKFSKE